MECKPTYENVKRGEIYYVANNKSDTTGSEQCNDRPAIIVSNDMGNTHSGIVEVVYLTTQPKKNLPTHVDIYTTAKQSIALCEQIFTVSKSRLVKYINQCSSREMEDIDNALIISLALSKAKGVVKYMEKWDKMIKGAIDNQQLIIESDTPAEIISDNHCDTTKVELELYKKFYNDTYELLKLSIGGHTNE